MTNTETTKRNNHVGLQLCFKCKEPKGILLASKYKPNGESVVDIPHNVATDLFLCDKCLKEMNEKDHVVFYECASLDPKDPKPTGRWVECNFSCINPKMPNYEEIKRLRFACMDTETFDFIMNKGEKADEKND